MRFLWRSLSFLIGAALMGLALWVLGVLPAYVFSKVGEFLVWISPVIAAIATVLIAYYTLILKEATDHLAGIAIKTADVQERDTKILQRAYLSAEPRGDSTFLAPDDTSPGDRVVGHVGFRNVGRLPARNVQWFLDMQYCADGERSGFKTRALTGKGNIVGPGTMMTQGAPNIPRETVRGYYYVWGKVVYDDGFGFERHTTFCHRYNTHRWLLDKKLAEYRTRPRYGRQHHHGNDAT